MLVSRWENSLAYHGENLKRHAQFGGQLAIFVKKINQANPQTQQIQFMKLRRWEYLHNCAKMYVQVYLLELCHSSEYLETTQAPNNKVLVM